MRLRSGVSDRRRSERKPFRVANFVGLSGSAGIWGPASTNSALLAVSEINSRGGILGRELELTFHDAGGRIDGVVRKASDIVANDEADLIMGSHISAVRVALRKVVSGHVPYIYTPVYEGGERTPGVMAIGETPRDQTRPAIEWLATAKRASRWYLIGSDYVWPWLSHKSTKKYIADAGGRVVGEEFVAMGEHNHSAAIARIRAAKPDVVMISLIGTDSVVFNRAFGECGLGSQMLRLCGAMDETLLLGIAATIPRTCSVRQAISWRQRRAPTTLSAAIISRPSGVTRHLWVLSRNRITKVCGFLKPSRRGPGACPATRLSPPRAMALIMVREASSI